jgi:AraC-like DNA-binding protein
MRIIPIDPDRAARMRTAVGADFTCEQTSTDSRSGVAFAKPRVVELRSVVAQPRPMISGGPASPHRGEYRSVSRSIAPIFDAEGRLAATLEVSFQDQHRAAAVLSDAVVHAAARSIEERLFRERYRREWIVALAPQVASRSAMLFAVDRHQRVVGADKYGRAMLAARRSARRSLDRAFDPTLWLMFEPDPTTFRSKPGDPDVSTRLVAVGTAEVWSALITPPEALSVPGQARHQLHTRPRTDSIGCVEQLSAEPQARGGLSPGALRRVREHIDANLDAGIDLKTLAEKVGLSRWHFARAFKQSMGATPHSYLMCRRLVRAQELLAETDLPLAEIALETGFSDQSHFSRRFREHLDVSPSMFRRAKR